MMIYFLVLKTRHLYHLKTTLKAKNYVARVVHKERKVSVDNIFKQKNEDKLCCYMAAGSIRLADATVFFNSIAIVIGPIPPGTGVTRDAV